MSKESSQGLFYRSGMSDEDNWSYQVYQGGLINGHFTHTNTNQFWLKRSLCNSISNPMLDTIYERAIAAGALDGKILGAGGDCNNYSF